jgi:hypothetical protein
VSTHLHRLVETDLSILAMGGGLVHQGMLQGGTRRPQEALQPGIKHGG